MYPAAGPTVGGLLEVDVGVSEGPAGDHVPADPDRQDGSGWAEFLVQHGLCHIWMEVPDVEGGHGVTGSTGVHAGRRRKLAQRSSQRRRKKNFPAKVNVNPAPSSASPLLAKNAL